MSSIIRSAVKHHFNWMRNDLFLFCAFVFMLFILLTTFNFHEIVEKIIVTSVFAASFLFTSYLSSSPRNKSQKGFSLKYYESLPISRAQITVIVVCVGLINLIPFLLWSLVFYEYLDFSFFSVFKLKILNLITHLLVLISMTSVFYISSLKSILYFPRKQAQGKNQKKIFVNRLKLLIIYFTGISLMGGITLYHNVIHRIPYFHHLGDIMNLLRSTLHYLDTSGFLFFLLFAIPAFSYFSLMKMWRNEKVSYLLVKWNPKKDLIQIGVCACLLFALFMTFHFKTPDYYTGNKILIDVKNKEYKKIDAYLAAGKNINYQNEFGVSLLGAAARTGNIKLYKYLEQKGAIHKLKKQVKKSSYMSKSVFVIAFNSQNIELIEYLIKNGADVNEPINNTGYVALHGAVYKCNNRLVELLLKHGANPNITNKAGKTPLFKAAENGCINAIISLSEAGAKLDVKDNNGKHILDSLARNYRSRAVKYYLEKRIRKPAQVDEHNK